LEEDAVMVKYEVGDIVYYVCRKGADPWRVLVAKVLGREETDEGMLYQIKGCATPLPENFLFRTPLDALNARDKEDGIVTREITIQ